MQIDPDRNHGTRECPSCACEVAKNNNRCPICGYEFPPPTQMGKVKWIAAILMLLILLVLLLP